MENEVDIRVTNRSIPFSEQEAPTEVRTDSDNLESTFWINHQRQAIQHQETGHTKVSITLVEHQSCDSRLLVP